MGFEPDQPSLANWIPYRMQVVEGQLLFRWLYIGTNRFIEPFFDETIAHAMSHAYNSTRWQSVSTFAGLVEASQEGSTLTPSAFIFHVSRCGSTLLSQLLSIPERHIMLSEMPLIDDILRFSHPAVSLSPAQKEEAVQAAIRLVGRQRSGTETQLFVKLDSWHLLFYDTFRRLYPTVPFILLYRSPDAVVRSHQKHRGMQAVPGVIEPALFGFNPGDVYRMPLDEYTAAVLGRYFQIMLSINERDENVHLLAYQENGSVMLAELLQQISIDVSPAELALMQQRSQYHAKRPAQPFREEMTNASLGDYLDSVMALYQQLEARRQTKIRT